MITDNIQVIINIEGNRSIIKELEQLIIEKYGEILVIEVDFQETENWKRKMDRKQDEIMREDMTK